MRSPAIAQRRTELVERDQARGVRAARSRRGAAAVRRPRRSRASKSEPSTFREPPFWGRADARGRSTCDELWPCFDLRSLYRLSWGAANTKGEAFERLVREEFEPRLRRYQAEALHDGLLQPRVVYGYFPAAGVGNEVDSLRSRATRARDRAFDVSATNRRRASQPRGLPARSRRTGGASDVVALQIVTVGRRSRRNAPKRCRPPATTASRTSCTGSPCNRPKRSPNTRTAASAASCVLDDERGKRYSWGYGACPDLEQHEIVFRLLDATAKHRRDADDGVPNRSRAIDRGDRHPPSARPRTSTRPPLANSPSPRAGDRTPRQQAAAHCGRTVCSDDVRTILVIGLAIVALVLIVALVRVLPRQRAYCPARLPLRSPSGSAS